MKYPVLATWASQSKTVVPPELRLMYVRTIARMPVIANETRGRPRESTFAMYEWMRPCCAMDCSIREATKKLSAAIAATAVIITALRISGSTLIPAWLMAMTKGDAATPLLPNKFLFSGETRIPIRVTEVR